MSFIGTASDLAQIRERNTMYGDACFRQAAEDWLACWTDDAVRIDWEGRIEGKAELTTWWNNNAGFIEKVAFFTEVGAIEVERDTATARCYTREIVKLKTGEHKRVVGIYRDVLVRQGETWLFAKREYELFMDDS